ATRLPGRTEPAFPRPGTSRSPTLSPPPTPPHSPATAASPPPRWSPPPRCPGPLTPIPAGESPPARCRRLHRATRGEVTRRGVPHGGPLRWVRSPPAPGHLPAPEPRASLLR